MPEFLASLTVIVCGVATRFPCDDHDVVLSSSSTSPAAHLIPSSLDALALTRGTCLPSPLGELTANEPGAPGGVRSGVRSCTTFDSWLAAPTSSIAINANQYVVD